MRRMSLSIPLFRVIAFHSAQYAYAIAPYAGLHGTYIGTIERAEQSIGLDNVEKIAKAFKVSIYELFRE